MNIILFRERWTSTLFFWIYFFRILRSFYFLSFSKYILQDMCIFLERTYVSLSLFFLSLLPATSNWYFNDWKKTIAVENRIASGKSRWGILWAETMPPILIEVQYLVGLGFHAPEWHIMHLLKARYVKKKVLGRCFQATSIF